MIHGLGMDTHRPTHKNLGAKALGCVQGTGSPQVQTAEVSLLHTRTRLRGACMRTKTIEESIKSRTQCGNVTVLNYQPGNGSRYTLHLTDLRAMEDGSYTVALVTLGHGTCMTVADTGGYLSPGYVAEKLKVGKADAVVLSEIIAHLTGRKADDASVAVNRAGQ